ncbi:MAG: hypothetical protein OXP28_05140 [Gammaproteobacteria bacterium]|nr:hypothetical protein [Gammaproteobacteria bacterium]
MTTYGAEWAKHRFYHEDPLPGIKPALLNSLDIGRYVDRGCLLEKERFDPERLKPASYELRLLGRLYWWEEDEGRLEKRSREIGEGDRVEISRNSISYLWTEEPLRLPEYVGARFNLRIRDVHKGILLGTGPLIDPGFGGRILIPLHNLTDNKYVLKGGDGIIWVEFTKVSPNRYWLAEYEEPERPKGLVPFPKEKSIDDPEIYLCKAGAARGVQSAYKGALDSARRDADDSRKMVKGIQTRVTAIGIATGLGVLVGIATLVFSAYEISGQVSDRVHSHGERLGNIERRLEAMNMRLNATDPSTTVAPTSAEAIETDEETPP